MPHPSVTHIANTDIPVVNTDIHGSFILNFFNPTEEIVKGGPIITSWVKW